MLEKRLIIHGRAMHSTVIERNRLFVRPMSIVDIVADKLQCTRKSFAIFADP